MLSPDEDSSHVKVAAPLNINSATTEPGVITLTTSFYYAFGELRVFNCSQTATLQPFSMSLAMYDLDEWCGTRTWATLFPLKEPLEVGVMPNILMPFRHPQKHLVKVTHPEKDIHQDRRSWYQ
jgi:hypothetical protein